MQIKLVKRDAEPKAIAPVATTATIQAALSNQVANWKQQRAKSNPRAMWRELFREAV